MANPPKSAKIRIPNAETFINPDGKVVYEDKDRLGRSHWRDYETGRYAKAPKERLRQFRYSYGFKWEEKTETLSYPIVIQGKYFGALIQSWSEDKRFFTESIKTALKQELLVFFLEWLNSRGARRTQYGKSQLWFTLDSGEGLQEVEPYSKRLEGKWFERIEDSNGRSLQNNYGDNENL